MGFVLSKKDVAVLEAEDNSTLAEWWAFLNGTPLFTCKAENIWSVMLWIEMKISIKECLRAWNSSMCDNDFEVWYEK